MIVDREARNLMTVIGSCVQVNDNAPSELVGMLGFVRDKGTYGVTVDVQGIGEVILRWDQIDYVGNTEQYSERKRGKQYDYADIEKLKTGATDAQAIQQQLQELQAKYQADTTALNQKLADQKEEYETTRATEKFFSGVEFSSELAREAAIERFRRQGFKRDGDNFTGGTEWLEKLRKDSPESFKAKEDPKGNPNPPENKPKFTRFLGGGDPNDGKPELPRVF